MKEFGYSTSEEYRFVKSLLTNFWKKFDQKDEEGRFKAKSLVAFVLEVLFLLILTSAAGLGHIFKALKFRTS